MKFEKDSLGNLIFPDLSKLADTYLNEAAKLVKEQHPEIKYALGLGTVYYGECESRGEVFSDTETSDKFDDFAQGLVVFKDDTTEFMYPKDEEWKEFFPLRNRVTGKVDVLAAFEVILKPEYLDETYGESFSVGYHHEIGFFYIEDHDDPKVMAKRLVDEHADFKELVKDLL